MKKIYYILITALTLGAFSACENYLDVDSPSTFTGDYIFSNPADAKKAILGVYSLFGEDAYTSRMSAIWMQNTDVEASGVSEAPDGSRRDIWSLEGAGLTGFSDILKGWDNNYLAIERANQCIEGISEEGDLTDRDMAHILGEAYCLRAYRYYLLCGFWGDVPYYDAAAKAGMELDLPRTDKNVIYSRCIQDLVNCENTMYWADGFSDGIERMNREFALGFAAKLALFRAGYAMTSNGQMQRADDYLDVQADERLAVTYTYNGVTKTARTSQEYFQLAADLSEKLITLKGRELTTDFATVFYNQCVLTKPVNDDVLYEVAFLAQYGGDVAWCVGATVNASSKGATTIQQYMNPYYFFSFDEDDTRRDVTCSYVDYKSDTEKEKPAGLTSIACGKWNRLWMTSNPGSGSSKGTGINWPVLRYADVLLMYAEALNEVGGPTSEAKNALKKVRARAFDASLHAIKVESYVNALSGQDDFRTAIQNERAWELGGEAVRRFDLVRWNKYKENLVKTVEEMCKMGLAARWTSIQKDQPSYSSAYTESQFTKYSNYADNLFYTKQTGEITFVNENNKYKYSGEADAVYVDYEVLNAANDGLQLGRQSWTSALYTYDEDKATGARVYRPADYIARFIRGFATVDASGAVVLNKNEVPYILPIASTTVANSDYLNNDGYLLK